MVDTAWVAGQELERAHLDMKDPLAVAKQSDDPLIRTVTFLLRATSGKMSPSDRPGGKSRRLVLTGVSETVMAYEKRPNRLVGSYPVNEFVDDVLGTPPATNGTITYRRKSDGQHFSHIVTIEPTQGMYFVGDCNRRTNHVMVQGTLPVIVTPMQQTPDFPPGTFDVQSITMMVI